ncbi:hypothetical protein ACIHJG_03270 [Streptomyces sp. NPDC052415]|jgi:hypothetical protein|uniref:hypothetical protein n=1 Tax=Streptomyces sp. NPDC052415 TaxID=3365690 RepID=UPI0037CD2694
MTDATRGTGTGTGTGTGAGIGTGAGSGAGAGIGTGAGPGGTGTGLTPGGETAVGGHTADPTRATRAETPGTGAVTGRQTGQAGQSSPLLPREEYDKLETRLQHAMTGFVDEPRASVEEADQALEELTSRLTDALTQRRRTLRGSWQGDERSSDTEQLRLALRDYRELADRLLRV